MTRSSVQHSAAVLIGAMLFAAGSWVGSAWGEPAEARTSDARPTPDWFLPIADAYDRDPRMTPEFDFASLYDSRPESYGPIERP